MSTSSSKADKDSDNGLLGPISRSMLLWVGLIILLGGFAFFRYSYLTFFPAPSLILRESEEMPYEVSRDGSFVLEFDQRMQKKSVEAQLSLEPKIPYRLTWEGRILRLKPEAALQPGVVYHLSVGAVARNMFGKPLEKSVVITYILGQDPKIVKIFPESEHLETGEKIILIFSHAMVRDSEVGKPLNPDFLTLAPAVVGEWEWRNAKVLVFTPRQPFSLSSRFHLQSTRPLQTYDATPLRESIDRTFETNRLTWLEEDEETESISVHEPVKLRFNQEVSMRSLQTHLELKDDAGKKVENLLITKKTEEENVLYEISSKSPWLYQETYHISLSSELMPLNGNLSLGKEVETAFQTEELFDDRSFAWSESKPHLVISNGEITAWLKEDVSEAAFGKALSFVPKTSFSVKKTSEKEYEISLPELSQKRESIKMYLSPALNPESAPYISRAKEFMVDPIRDLSVETIEEKDLLCIYTNLPLAETSLIKGESNSWKIEPADPALCEKESALRYAFEKKFLPPSKMVRLTLAAKDVFGQSAEQEIQFRTPALTAKGVEITPRLSDFYTSVSSTTDLKFPYATTNIQRLQIEICKLKSDLVVKIEGSYEEKWNNFSPTAQKCIQYKSLYTDLEVTWGKKQNHLLDLNDHFNDLETGLYYINVSSPSYFDDDGRALQANGVLSFTHWKVFSKKGDSALLWISESDRPVANAEVKLYASDGSLLESGKTDRQGLFFLENNKTTYEFISATKGPEDIVLNVFSQEGFEPHRYGVPFNTDESPYLYQFYLEKKSDDNVLKGVFILKDKADVPRPPKVSGATVTLYTEEEELLWRRYEPMDDYGNLKFEIFPTRPLLVGRYQLGVCLGLHEGVCHGTYLWTTINPAVQEEPLAEKPSEKNTSSESGNIVLEREGELKVGQEISIQLQHLIPGIPVLMTVERNQVLLKKIITPKNETESVPMTITEQMIPEAVLSIVQFAPGKTQYDMEVLPIEKQNKKLRYQTDGTWTSADGKALSDLSQIAFDLPTNQIYDDSLLFDSFYPLQGTSMITSALGSEFADLSRDEYQLQIKPVPEYIWIDGMIRENAEPSDRDSLIIAHDKNGNFGTILLSQERKEKQVALRADVPEFSRISDQTIFTLEISNRSDQNKNLELLSSGDGLEFFTGDRIFLGIPASQTKTLQLASKNNIAPGQRELPLQLELINKDQQTEDQIFRTIPIAYSRLFISPEQLVTYESSNGQGQMQLPVLSLGQWERKIIASPSPLTYTLENVKSMIQKEALSFEETIFKRTIEANYSNLMKNAWDESELFQGITEKRTTVENLLYFLETRQKNDGGWSQYPDDPVSEPLLSSWIAKSIASLEQLRFDVPEAMRRNAIRYLKDQLDQRANLRIKDQIKMADVPEAEVFTELQILNALSSFTPSGISYANNWYLAAENLPSHSLVLLLLTLEDYRDGGVAGTNFKIEELIQILKSRQQTVQNQVWLLGDPQGRLASNFLTTSWYLEALVRQASARDDIPSIITWLVQNKYRQEYQSPKDQFTFLQSMASYLRIYQEQVTAENLRISLGFGKSKSFTLIPEKPFQSFFIQDAFYADQDDAGDLLEFSTDQPQPLFIEVNFRRLDRSGKAVNNGLSVYQSFEQKPLKVGEKLKGTLSIISPEPLRQVIITQPIISAAKDLHLEFPHEGWEIKKLGSDEKWYLIDELPAGETIIPFEWELTHAGIFKTPQVHAYEVSRPKTLSSSNVITLEVRNE